MGQPPSSLLIERTRSPLISQRRADQLNDLLSLAFNVTSSSGALQRPASFYDDFPIWRPGASPAVNFYMLIGEKDELVSTVGLRSGRLRALDGKSYEVEMMGAVATHSAFRGRGYAAHLIEAAVQEVKRSEVDAIVLWDSSQSALYRRLGFNSFREEYLFRLSDFFLKPRKKAEWKLRSGWNDKIFQAVLDRRSGLRYEHRDLEWYSRHRHTRWYWVEEKGLCVAWCAVNRGIDLNGIVHEWHGAGDCLQYLLSEVSVLEPGALLMGPEPPEAGLSFEKTAQGLILPLRADLDWSKWWFWGLDAA